MSSVIDGVDYGPLAQLIGKWIGVRGLDIAPDADAQPDKNAYIDGITFVAAGPAENAEEQQLVSVRYHQVVRKKENNKIFHDQIGHWIYEPNTQTIMHSLTIPRGVCLLAGGKYQQQDGISLFSVTAKAGDQTYGIVQSPFILEKATTTAFKMAILVKGDELSYEEVTSLHIYGKDFEHSDKSTLSRVVYDQD